MTKIDTMVDSFRNSVLEEVERFKHKILQQNPNGTIIPQRFVFMFNPTT